MGGMDLDGVADELYGLVPGEFTRRRDARALEARKAGDRELAAAVKALRRPTTSAWLANALVRERPEHVADLVELGTAMRRAQADLAGADLRRLAKERHRVVAALAQEARGLAREVAEPVSSAAAKELTDTLEAVVFDTAAADALRSGRLTMALRYSGLGAVDPTGAVRPYPAPSPPARPAAPDRRPDPHDHGARREPDEAEREQDGDKREQDEAERERHESEATAAEAEAAEAEAAEAEAAEAEAAAAEAAAAAADAAAAAAEETARTLGQTVTDAGRELDRIRAAMADISEELERLRAAEVQAQQSVDDVKKAYDAAEAASSATRQRVADAKSALGRAQGRRGLSP
jgi:hypothetical protein